MAMAESSQAPAAGETATGFGLRRALSYAAGNVGAGMVWAFANAALPFYLASYGLPNSLIGLLSQPRPPVAGVLQVLVGRWSDRTRTRLGRRRPFILGAAPLAALALAGLAARPPLPVMLVLLIGAMSCLAIAYAPYLALLPDLVPEGEQSRVEAYLTIGGMVGQVLALVLAARFWSEQPAAVISLVAAGLLAGFAVCFRGVGEPAHGPGAVSPPPPPLRQYVGEVLSHRAMVAYLVASGLFWLAMGAVVPFLTRFGVVELGADEPTAFGLLMIVIGSTAVCAVPAGWLGDRWGKRRTLRLGLVVMAASLLAGSQARSLPEVVAALVISGAGNALCTVALYPLLASLIPAERAGEFTGLGYGLWELVQPVGAALAGAAIDLSGSLRAAVVLGGLLLVASAVALNRVPGAATAPTATQAVTTSRQSGGDPPAPAD